MPDTGIMAVSAQIALIIGGTQPDATHFPYFYSGAQTGDATGISGLGGCYAAPPSTISATAPYAILMLRQFSDTGNPERPRVLTSGTLWKEDVLRCLIAIPRDSNTFEKQYATVLNLRDTLGSALKTTMTVGSSANYGVYQVWPFDGNFVELEWAGIQHWALEMRIYVHRNVLGTTYTP